MLTHLTKQKTETDHPKSKDVDFKGSLTLTLVRTLLIFTLLPLVVMGGVAYIRTRAMIREQSIKQTQAVMTAQLNQSIKIVEEKEKRLSTLVQDQQFSEGLESAFHANRQSSTFEEVRGSVLRRFIFLNNVDNAPKFDQFFLLGSDGTIEIATNTGWEGTLITDPVVLDRTQSVYGSILTYNLSPLYPDQLILLTAIQYRTPTGSALGTVVGVTEAKDLAPILQSVQDLVPTSETYFFLPPNILLAIDDDSGELVLSTASIPQDVILNSIDQTTSPTTSTPVAVEYVNPEGFDSLAHAEWLPSVNAGVILELHQDAILGQLNSLASFTIALILLSLIAMALVIWTGTNRVIKPLHTLAGITQKFAQGDWSQRASVKTKDEIGLLAYSFNNMADQLSELYRSLEQKVDERTRQIRTASEVAQNAIGPTVQNMGPVEAAHINVQELERLYRATHLIAEADSEKSALDITGKILKVSPYPYVILRVQQNGFNIESYSGLQEQKIDSAARDLHTGEGSADLIHHLSSNGVVITGPNTVQKLGILTRFTQELGCHTAAFLPVKYRGHIAAIIMLGSTDQALTPASIQPYAQMADLLSATLEKIASAKQTELHLTEMGALATLSQVISASSSLESFYAALHEQVRKLIGDYSFVVALYDEKTDTISIPYTYEDGKVSSIETFPLGEGLTSILIRTKQPLMLVEDTENRAAALGAKIVGRPARSWLGTPLLIQNRPIGALIIQDPEREHVFNEDNLRFFTALASQVAGVIYNVILLDESQNRTIQLQTAAEIARDISASQNLDELLLKAVNLICDRFNFYHAGIFLIDLPGEFAVIREATGEAGAQLKRNGYKLGVGSKSIIGYVASHGEPLVVNDTTNDSTFLPNPLLPDTHSEATIPLKVAERILGVLDVQSNIPYAFAEDNLRTLQILADQLAIAVVNTELFAETQEHLSQHRLLHHITTATASGSTLEEALDSAVNGLQVSLGGDRVTILLADKDKRYLEIKAAVGYSEEVIKQKIQIGSGITGWAAAHRRSIKVNDVRDDARYIQISTETRSELAVPLIYRNEMLGVLNVESEQIGAYTENDEEMLGTLGGSLAAIIANARLLEQIRNQAERERLLFEMTNKIRRSSDVQTILNTTASELSRVIGARRTRIKININNSDDK